MLQKAWLTVLSEPEGTNALKSRDEAALFKGALLPLNEDWQKETERLEKYPLVPNTAPPPVFLATLSLNDTPRNLTVVPSAYTAPPASAAHHSAIATQHRQS